MNMFAKAKKDTEVAPKVKGKKSTKVEIPIANLEKLATIDVIEKALKGVKAKLADGVKDVIGVEFLKMGLESGKKPESFTGTDGDAEANCQLKKRSSASKLSDDEQEILKDYGISVKTEVSVEETYVINPLYKDDGDLLEQVSKKISGIKGLPEDFIIHQPEVSKVVTTDDSIDEAFKLDEDEAEEVLDIISILAVKPTMENADIAVAIKSLNDILNPKKKVKK